MDTLRWLHLSDVHFSDGESYEIKRMRDSIIDKMKEVFEKNKVDFVVLSGDLAYQGGGYDANLKKFIEIIYVFLTIFLYLLKCPQSLIL